VLSEDAGSVKALYLRPGCWMSLEGNKRSSGNHRFDYPNVFIVPEVFDVPISKVYSNMIKYGGSMCFLYTWIFKRSK
jgi:hypothetical protein